MPCFDWPTKHRQIAVRRVCLGQKDLTLKSLMTQPDVADLHRAAAAGGDQKQAAEALDKTVEAAPLRMTELRYTLPAQK